MSPDSLLPEYSKPPVEEVAISIMFESLEGLSSAHVGKLWHRYEGFPRTEDQPELDLPVEEATRTPPKPPTVELTPTPHVRTWFLSQDGTQLIQVQRNRFAYNWRRGDSDATYPRYEVVREQFLKALTKFRDFLSEQKFPELRLVQCEITYVNHIRGESGGGHAQLSEVVRTWQNSGVGFLPDPEDVRFLARYVMSDNSGGFLGRLAVSLNPAYLRHTGDEILVLTLVARGKPMRPDIDGALDFFDLGHQWIVRGFTEMTTPEMHKVWERRR